MLWCYWLCYCFIIAYYVSLSFVHSLTCLLEFVAGSSRSYLYCTFSKGLCSRCSFCSHSAPRSSGGSCPKLFVLGRWALHEWFQEAFSWSLIHFVYEAMRGFTAWEEGTVRPYFPTATIIGWGSCWIRRCSCSLSIHSQATGSAQYSCWCRYVAVLAWEYS